jgi:hypothetical protein
MHSLVHRLFFSVFQLYRDISPTGLPGQPLPALLSTESVNNQDYTASFVRQLIANIATSVLKKALLRCVCVKQSRLCFVLRPSLLVYDKKIMASA